MQKQTYTIRPLRWKKQCDSPEYKSWNGQAQGGWWMTWDIEEGYQASYSFSDWYDEDNETFKTLKEAKAWCEAEYVRRDERFLVKIKS